MRLLRWFIVVWAVSWSTGPLRAEPPASSARATGRIEFVREDKVGRLRAMIDGKEAFSFHYAAEGDLPYIVPRSPSGKAMTVVKTNPYPHHRSLWFGDRVELAGVGRIDVYNALYSRADKKDPNSPFGSRVRLVELSKPVVGRAAATIRAKLLWEKDQKTPVLDEARRMRLTALGAGEYLLDLTFTVTAGYGDVTFVSDAVHYAWPYVRMAPAFSVLKGGTMTSSTGGVNQKGTHGKDATWVDYTNTIDGVTEGLAVLSHSDNRHPHRWLTRDYGTFGPRRIDARSGKRFTLVRGQSLARRVGILVHTGNVTTGRVGSRYAEYIKPVTPAGRRNAR